MLFNKLTNYQKHEVFKNVFGPYVSVIIAQYFSLDYEYSAATICILSLQSTRKSSFRSSMERIIAASFGVLLSAIIIKICNYNSISLAIFSAIFLPICIRFNLIQGFFTNIVLATHFLLKKDTDFLFILDQYFLLIIGIGIAIFFKLYMPSQNNEILSRLDEIDSIMKDIFLVFSKKVKYKKILEKTIFLEEDELFQEVKNQLDECKILVQVEKENNFFFKEKNIDKNYNNKYSEYLSLIKINDCLKEVNLERIVSEEIQYIFIELSSNKENEYTYNLLLKKIDISKKLIEKNILKDDLSFEIESSYFRLIRNLELFIKLKKNNMEFN
ncbi:MAG: aromatic acid exporter family protein [Cetobacterium sp.]|uniref:aromatic acid exporter family protein n=3 Tax=Cetobacterium sp. TaxID=2071632 RepID=UPI002FC7871A